MNEQKTQIEQAIKSTDRLAEETSTLNLLISRFLESTEKKRIITQTAVITVVAVFVAIMVYVGMAGFCQERDGVCDLIVPVSQRESIQEIIENIDDGNSINDFSIRTVAGASSFIDALPAFTTTQQVRIAGSYCFDSDAESAIETGRWTSVDPRGVVAEMQPQEFAIVGGCNTVFNIQSIPQEVINAVNAGTNTTWTITGSTRSGDQVTLWTTEPFIIYAGG